MKGSENMRKRSEKPGKGKKNKENQGNEKQGTARKTMKRNEKQ